MIIQGINLHVYPAPILGESRIFRETKVLEESNLFTEIVVCGTNDGTLPRNEQIARRVMINRITSSNFQRPRNVIVRTYTQILWSFKVYFQWKSSNLSAVNAHSVAVLPLCFLLARRTNARLIYDTHELETESSTSKGIQRFIFKIIEKCFAPKSSLIITVNESIALWYKTHYPRQTVISVANYPDIQKNIPGPSDIKAQLGISSSSILYVHVGNLCQGRFINEILQVFSSRVGSHDHVLFLGDGPLWDEVQQFSLNHQNIHIHPKIAYDEVVPFISACDVGLCFIEPSCLSYELSLPNKAIEYLAAKLPFFHSSLPEVTRILGFEDDPWSIDLSVDSLRNALDQNSVSMINIMKNKIQQVPTPLWEVESKRMISAYKQILDSVG